MAAKKKPAQDTKGTIIQHIDIRQISRTNVDISTWRQAIQSAESVTNPNRKQLYELYADMMLDGRLSSVIGKRITAITNTDLKFLQDGEEVEAIQNIIDTEEFTDLLTYILEARFWGYSLIELAIEGEKIIPTIIDRRHVKPKLGIVVKTPGEMTGIPYKEPPYNNYVIGVGKKNDLGLILSACQYVIYKRGGFGDWAQFSELFGMPFRKAKYDGYDEGQRLKLTQALEEAGSASYVVIPEGSDIDFIQNSGNSGSAMLYKELKDACNEEITVKILGNTLTTSQGDKGARSLGEVHQQDEGQIKISDKKLIIQTLNHKLLPLLRIHGYPVGNGKFTYPNIERISKKDKLDMDIKLNKIIPMSDDYFYEAYDRPKPDNYDELKANQQAQREAAQKLLQRPAKEAKNIRNLFKGFF